ncbi:protein of unknown function [Tepidibacter aestuarii]|nr:protein of unknown function [Tepidibacter aestuarii]
MLNTVIKQKLQILQENRKLQNLILTLTFSGKHIIILVFNN